MLYYNINTRKRLKRDIDFMFSRVYNLRKIWRYGLLEINKELHQKATDYSMSAIKYICTELPPRESGSQGERQAQEYLKSEIIDNGWADSVTIEEFPVAPKAFMGFSKILPILILIGIIFYAFGVVWAPLIMCVISLVIFIAEFGLYKQFLDPLFKTATSSNLIAVKNPQKTAKKRIIFSGHSDAAYEWTIFNKFGKGMFIGGLALAIIGVLLIMALSIASIAIGYKLWMLIVMLCCLPGFVALFFFSNFKKVVQGANDNLTGTLAAISVLKYLKEAGIEYEDTEVMALITGSEEAGLRGAKAFAAAHKEQCEEIPTMFIGLETFRDLPHMTNYVRDLSGTVKHHPEAIALIDEAAEKVFGKPLPHGSVFLGASDSAAMSQAGIKAGAIAAMDPAPAAYYHTRKDNCDNLDPECFSKGLELTLTVLGLYAKK